MQIRIWQQILDELAEGIVFINQKKEVLYKNFTANEVFGLNNEKPVSEV